MNDCPNLTALLYLIDTFFHIIRIRTLALVSVGNVGKKKPSLFSKFKPTWRSCDPALSALRHSPD